MQLLFSEEVDYPTLDIENLIGEYDKSGPEICREVSKTLSNMHQFFSCLFNLI